MFWKLKYLSILIFLYNHAETTLQKSFHYYFGLFHLMRQQLTTQVSFEIIKEKNDDDDDDDNDNDDDDNNKKKEAIADSKQMKPADKNPPILFFIFDSSQKTSNYDAMIKAAAEKGERAFNFTHGFLFSVYLGEMMDIISFGICCGNQLYTEDCVSFNTISGGGRAATEESIHKEEKDKKEEKKEKEKGKGLFSKIFKKKKKKEKETPIKKNELGQIYLQRYIPFMIGGFIQAQNDDLDSYFIGARINVMIGLLNNYLITKDIQTILNDQLTTKGCLKINTTIALNISLQIVFKIFDLEGSIIFGVTWAPMGIKITSNQASKKALIGNSDDDDDDNDDDNKVSNIQIANTNIQTNHFCIFIALSIGVSF